MRNDRDDLTTMMLGNVARQLALLPMKDIEEHVASCDRSLRDADSFGCLLDPTAWLRATEDGTKDDAANQLQIAKHLLAARRAIDKREAFVASKRTEETHATR